MQKSQLGTSNNHQNNLYKLKFVSSVAEWLKQCDCD